eukprot:CAMPEP_0197460266 /NCGR_PEP_ID=MMETSP1175-20131217/53643_1 /TAXON_ID=1003142 /ORGANISM="Triceratium dubium, Strain CCMP147" /LENGTH=267 /DNA_ID=CAMNT_0042995329 /DNA_START=119 /DNA_END=922 /DNA_ORIENTATION=+
MTAKLLKHHGGFLHMHYMSCQPKDRVLLLSLRNPIERFISWFNYEHVSNPPIIRYINGAQRRRPCPFKVFRWQGKGCFKTPNEFAENCTSPGPSMQPLFTRQDWISANLTTINHYVNSSSCQQLAWMVARGHAECAAHNFFHFGFYSRQVDMLVKKRPDRRVLGMRTEFLAEDWNEIERYFGGGTQSGSALFKTILNASTKKNSTDRPLSDLGYENLCRALCPEIQVYKRLLHQVENLNASQVRDSIVQVMSYCPQETEAIRKCPNH